MTTVFPISDFESCALCGCHIESTRHLCNYVVGARGVIVYLLCESCGKKARAGLPDEQLRKLDVKLEREAQLLGLTQTQ